jgi:6-phosphogluconolactonase
MAEEIEWWDFDAAEDLIDAVVGDVSFIIESALDARGQALVAFPGGSSQYSLEKCNDYPNR